MEYALGSCVWILACLWASVTLVKKAGLPGWYGVLLVIPGICIIGFFIVAFRSWPVVQEVRELRLRCGVATEEDAAETLDQGIRLEVRGYPDRASAKYKQVVEGLPASASAKAAEERLRDLSSAIETDGKRKEV
ncbi:MAG: hypothetical protein ABII12_05720 [Planctomycetota bacterium]